MRTTLLVLAVVAAGASSASAQQQRGADLLQPPTPHLYITANIGLARRQDMPWESIHQSLNPSGWDSQYPTNPCTPHCAGASDAATGHPVAPTLAIRIRGSRRPWHLRGFAAYAPLGAYPGSSGGVQLAIRPAVTVVGVQGAWAWHGVWVALGPTVNLGRVVEEADSSRQVASGVRAGLGFGVGLMVARRGPWFVDIVVERRMAGAVDLPAMPVPGQPTVPAMRVPLSHTILAIGVGLRK